MSPSRKKSQYNIAKFLHWIVALIAVLLLMSGWRAADIALESRSWFMMVHSGLGLSVFALMIFRLWWRKSRNLYSHSRWYKNPSILLRRLFYPLLILHPIIGILQAVFNEYDVIAFGLINFSAIAVENEALFSVFHKLHEITAITLIVIFFLHVIDVSRKFFVDDGDYLGASAKPVVDAHDDHFTDLGK